MRNYKKIIFLLESWEIKSQGIDYLELRCVDLNPYDPIGITEDQINFLDTLLIYCFVSDSPLISLEESLRLQRNHGKIVNDGRDELTLLETVEGSVPVKEEAHRILSELEIIAEFMDVEVHKDQDLSWLQSVSKQKENLISANGTLSAQIIEDLQENNLSFRELGNKMSKTHLETITSATSELDKLFLEAS